MGLLDRDAENRKSFRCPTSATDDRAELRIGRRRIPVQLHDESAGGFAVTAAECPEVKRGDVFQLHLDSRVFDVCLIHLLEEEASDRGHGGKIYRIGLERRGEVVEPPTTDTPYRRVFSDALQWLFPSAPMPASSLGVVLAIAVVASPLAFGALFYHYHRTTSGASPDAPVRIAESTAQPSARAAGERPGGHESGVARTGPTDDRLKASNRASDWATIARLPGAAPLLTSPAIRELGLTEDQQRRIREIVDETAEAFKQLDAQFRGISRQEQSRAEGRLLEAARDEAFGLLTPEQRRQFQAATDKAQQP